MGMRLESAIEHVTVFPGAARVTRVARATIRARSELEIAGLPLALDEDTLQVALAGPARAADVRVTIEVTAREAATVADDELAALRRALAAAQAARDHLRGELGALSAMASSARGERELPPPAWADALAARLAVLEARAAREAAVREELAAAERTAIDAERALAAARDRRARASTARRDAGALRKTAVITVEPEGAGGEVTIELGYLVSGARWAPSYAARLDGGGGLRLELRASVAQTTGEDWSQVKLAVSTAAPGRWLELPELPARRIGRRQPAPAKPGWRPPPVGVDALFADFDRGFPARPVPPPVLPEAPRTTAPPAPAPTSVYAPGGIFGPPLAPPPGAAPPMQALAEPPSPPMSAPMMGPQARGGGGGAEAKKRMAAAPPPAPSAMPALEQAMMARNVAATRGAAPESRAAIGADGDANVEAELVVGAQLLVYARLRMAGPHERRRGHLVPMERAEAWGVPADVAAAASDARSTGLAPLPPGLREVSRGVYDHSFAGEAQVDVPADGSWHNLALLARDAAVTLGHVAVPSIALDVYRQATFANPLDAPMLAGPVDVYDRGELVTTTTVDTTAPGATVELGLGVDANVKIARNARYREEAAGMLRGALRLIHELTIDVENLGARPVALEVRERVPVPDAGTDDVEVAIDRVQPPWEAWRPEAAAGAAPLRGGHRWRIDVAPRAKVTLRADYHVRISQKHELVGGNRREA